MNAIFKLFDRYPVIPFGILAVFVVMALLRFRRPKAACPNLVKDKLESPLFYWTPNDPFRVRDLLNGGLCIMGCTGSGKTSSSGSMIFKSILDNPHSAGLLLCAKAEDEADAIRVFEKVNRTKDLILFGPNHPNRTNFLGCLRTPRDVVTFLITLSESLKRGDSKGGDNNRFYDQQESRCLYNAVAALQAAREPLTAPNIHHFIMTAAVTPAELVTAEWQSKYCGKVLERAHGAKKTPLEEHDFQLCADFWIREWAGLMDVKTRGNILAGVQGMLFVMNSGLMRELCSSVTTCSPQDVLNGKWIVVSAPQSVYGETGKLISVGYKHLLQLAILERHATDADPFCVIWADEAQGVTTSFDAVTFIPQCRSHKGAMAYLTQGVSSLYSAMSGANAQHEAENLLGQFATVIAHPCDPVTARWLASKLGRHKETLFSGSSQPGGDVLDELMGKSRRSSSFSESYQDVLQVQEFMIGRTGGPANGFLADAIVIKSGESFADGKHYKRVTFSQKPN